ncbi:thioredoxin family protein [Schlesneria sp. DSM 10557]|uniref:thioredoxin family protein n=1 Tax=Schlesneria sp. DSM 10557 TaxID=3044399 RepID=UPI0035A03884
MDFKTFTPSILATILLTLCGMFGMQRSTPTSTPITVNVIGAGPANVQATIYSADYCVPCKTYIKAVRAEMPADGWIVKDAADRDVKSAHIVIDKRAAELARNGIESIPCTVFRKDGKEVRRITGAISPADLAKQFNEIGTKP